jgi:hypothetical protein
MRATALSIAIVGSLVAGCQSAQQHHSCVQKQQVVERGGETVDVALSPFTPSTISIPTNGISLGKLIDQEDGMSVAITSKMASDFDPVLQQNFELDVHPNIMVHVRDNVWTAIPRAMLLHPVVYGLPIKSGDQVFTFNQNDFADLFVDDIPQAGGRKIVVTGDLVEPNARGTALVFLSGTPGGVTPSPEAFRVSSLNGIADLLAHRGSIVDSGDQSVPVAVINRYRGGVLWRFVCPLRTTGAFAVGGPILKSIVEDPRPTELWNALFASGQRTGEINVREGDVVDISNLERIDPFTESCIDP